MLAVAHKAGMDPGTIRVRALLALVLEALHAPVWRGVGLALGPAHALPDLLRLLLRLLPLLDLLLMALLLLATVLPATLAFAFRPGLRSPEGYRHRG